MKHDEQLQISEFIKDPANLKLLILAGTNIRLIELQTVTKCISLIKLDLSSNLLSDVPLRFHTFSNMKILYLHDNKLTSAPIARTTVEYVSLFQNPLTDYREALVSNNSKLLGIDYNVVTRMERLQIDCKNSYSEIKWPIVEISQPLEQEEDYLNLLRAEIFVIHNIHQRTVCTEIIRSYVQSWQHSFALKDKVDRLSREMHFQQPFVLVVAQHWKEYARKKGKMRAILAKRGKQSLMNNRLQANFHKRSRQAGVVLNRFIQSIRMRMKARGVLERNLFAFRSLIPIQQKLLKLYYQSNTASKLYFKDSQYSNLEKIFLYAKRLLFKQKQYDLCDQFHNIVNKSQKTLYLYRSRKPNIQNVFLQDMISETMGMVLAEKGVDRKHLLYNKKGHRGIQIKHKKMQGIDEKQRTKSNATAKKLDSLYLRYDQLVAYEIRDHKVYDMLVKIIRFFNAGNSGTILSNQTAYFQTEVVFETEESVKERLYVGVQFFVQRAVAAVKIQRFWRRIRSLKTQRINTVSELKGKRADGLIKGWLRDIIFQHRMALNKWHSFTRSTWRQSQLFIHLDIYMSLPLPTDFLRYHWRKSHSIKNTALYDVLHRKTEVQIVSEYKGRKWLKFIFRTPQDAYLCQKELSILTYRYYYNGFFLRIFTLGQIEAGNELTDYEAKVAGLFKIKVGVSQGKEEGVTKIDIGNPQPYFVWAGEEERHDFAGEDIRKVPVSIFIYNKNKRPLKVNCEFAWATPQSIYRRVKKEPKVKPSVQYTSQRKQSVVAHKKEEHYLPELRTKQRRHSVREYSSLLKGRKKGFTERFELGLLSETLNIRKK